MIIKYTLKYFKNNFCDISKWYRKNYRLLPNRERTCWKQLLNVIANLMILDNIAKKGYPKEWGKKYENNIEKAVEIMNELKTTHNEDCKNKRER